MKTLIDGNPASIELDIAELSNCPGTLLTVAKLNGVTSAELTDYNSYVDASGVVRFALWPTIHPPGGNPLHCQYWGSFHALPGATSMTGKFRSCKYGYPDESTEVQAELVFQGAPSGWTAYDALFHFELSQPIEWGNATWVANPVPRRGGIGAHPNLTVMPTCYPIYDPSGNWLTVSLDSGFGVPLITTESGEMGAAWTEDTTISAAVPGSLPVTFSGTFDDTLGRVGASVRIESFLGNEERQTSFGER